MNEPVQTYYESASHHFVSRFQMRDNITLVFLAATGTVLGIAFGTNVQTEVLLVLPFLALGCSFLVVHHNVMLESLLAYLSKEIPPYIQNTTTAGALPYEASQSIKKYFDKALNLRTYGQLFIFGLPSVFSLCVNIERSICGAIVIVLAFWFAVLCTLGTAFFIWTTHKQQIHSIDHLRR